jgi:hypothetical protein
VSLGAWGLALKGDVLNTNAHTTSRHIVGMTTHVVHQHNVAMTTCGNVSALYSSPSIHCVRTA